MPKGHAMNPGKHVRSAPEAVSDDTDFKDVLVRRPGHRRPAVRRPLRDLFGTTQLRRLLSCLLGACVAGPLSVGAQPTPSDSRGELLYSTHCVGCHTTQVHWRDNKLATDWTTLRAQVRRWESNIGMNWSDDDIVAVARYLNEHYYRFPAPETTAAVKRPSPRASAP
jgi:cytochrome c553